MSPGRSSRSASWGVRGNPPLLAGRSQSAPGDQPAGRSAMLIAGSRQWNSGTDHQATRHRCSTSPHCPITSSPATASTDETADRMCNPFSGLPKSIAIGQDEISKPQPPLNGEWSTPERVSGCAGSTTAFHVTLVSGLSCGGDRPTEATDPATCGTSRTLAGGTRGELARDGQVSGRGGSPASGRAG